MLFRSSFDAVLVDPPCSDLGTIRRHPDIKWIKSPDLINELSELQLKIMNIAAKYVKPEGVMVYAVCTITPKENEQVIGKFMEDNPTFGTEPITEILPDADEIITEEGWGRMMPHRHGTDGFFFARLRRNSR